MSRLTLRLPETLHKQLVRLADREGVSLNQYIVYSLTRQAGTSYSVQIVTDSDVEQQKNELDQWLQSSATCSDSEALKILAEREPIEEKKRLDPEVMARFRRMIQKEA